MKPSQTGLGMVEILVTAGIISVTLLGIQQFLSLTNITNANQERRAQATWLAQEAVEAVRILRDDNWTNNIATLAPETTYYPVLSSGAWTLTTTDPGPIDGVFNRTVVTHTVRRDAADDIATSGSVDPNTYLITARVTWVERGQSRSLTIETYITNFLDT